MEAAQGPPRFKCPSDFSASPFCPETLQGPSKELWLIRAPANFSPESLNGHTVTLLGFQTLKALHPDGTERIFHIQTTLEHLSSAQLLVPSGQGDHLTSSPPFSSSLSICERFGDPSNNQLLFPVVARPAPQIPQGLKQRFLPFGNHPERPLLPRAVEKPPRKKKKKMKKSWFGKEEAEEELPLFGVPLGEATAAGKAEVEHRHKNGTALLAGGSQQCSMAAAQDSLVSGEVKIPDPRSKKRKRKEDKKLKEMGAEAGGQHKEVGAAVQVVESQPNSTAFAQAGLLSAKVEDPGPGSKKKRKKRKKDGEMKEEAGAPCLQEENDTAPQVLGSQLSSEPLAQGSLHSGAAENPGPQSKRKKRKEGREVMKDNIEGEGALDLSPCLGGGSEPQAGDDSLPGIEEVTQHIPKGKRKEKAAPTELVSINEVAARMLWNFSNLGDPTEEKPKVVSSSHKAKKKKKKKEEGERPEEGAQEFRGQSSLLEGESWAPPGGRGEA